MNESKDIQKAANLLKHYENLCNERKGGTPESISTLRQIKELLEKWGYEFCAHNAAILGSERYAKWKESQYDRLITFKEYEGLNA